MSKGKRIRAQRKAKQSPKPSTRGRWVSSLPPDPRGSALKIAHAQDHLEEIGELIQAWIDASLKTLAEEPDPDAPGYFIAWVEMAEIDVKRLSLLIGDCLQAFRSGLDHLAFELSSVFTVPMTEVVEKASAFPILSGYRLPGGGLHTVEGGTPYTLEIGGQVATKGRTKVARWPMIPIDPSKPMHMNFRPTLDVHFAANTPLVGDNSVLSILGEINNYVVGDVIPPLDALLK